MIKLLFYNKESRDSQMAYKALMQAGVDIKTIEITGKNVAKRVKAIGITHVPTLYLRDKRNTKMLVGNEILEFLQNEEESEDDVPPQYKARQTYAPPTAPVEEAPQERVESELISEGSDINSEEVLEVDNSEIESAEDALENDKGKLNPGAVMKMMQSQNSTAQGMD